METNTKKTQKKRNRNPMYRNNASVSIEFYESSALNSKIAVFYNSGANPKTASILL